jgi:hypothetical protein
MSDDRDKIISLASSAEPDQFEALLAKMEKRWPIEARYAAFTAKLAKVKFDAFKKEGFSVHEALQLTMRDMFR